MSGRGRGRGRGRAPPTGGKMFLMRSAEECGFDPKKFRTFGQTELFPDIMFHSSGDNKRLRLLEEQRLLQEEQAAAATVQGVKVEGSSGSGSGGGDNKK
mmetsp:Transcript_18271/g.22995  ORF Transcript_18271/g.22995 Transcript_18271/m.22995 type:complete len:99 (-) Transcript_18271:437-733(-)